MIKEVLVAALLAGLCHADSANDGLKAYKQQEYGKAVELWSKACDSGDARGCINLGIMYENGTGVTQDSSKAGELWFKACNGGDTGGCFNLGAMYFNGSTTVRQDKGTALKYFGKACDMKNALGCEYYAKLKGSY